MFHASNCCNIISSNSCKRAVVQVVNAATSYPDSDWFHGRFPSPWSTMNAILPVDTKMVDVEGITRDARIDERERIAQMVSEMKRDGLTWEAAQKAIVARIRELNQYKVKT